MNWKKVKLKEVLKQYRVQHIVQDDIDYKQVSILNDGSVVLRGNKIGKQIGRKRQFKIDLNTYPDTLIFTRQLLLQGSIGIASDDVNDCIVTENMPMFSIQTSKIDKDFLILFLKSEVFKSRIRKIELSGSAQKSIHERTFLDLEFLLPEIEFQKEIVVELLKLKSNSMNISVEIIIQLNLIKQMRQAFLREAMQGKLVKSTNTKETGQQLLAKIKAEKAKLITEKKLKKEKELPPITEEEIPFEIPEHWAWCRGNDLATYIDPQPSHRTPPESKDGVPYVAMSDIKKDGTIDFNFTRKVSLIVLEEHKNRYKLEEGDFIFGKIGTIGKPVLLPKPFEYTLSANVILIQANRKIVRPDYLFYFLGSPIAEKNLIDKKSTTSYPVFGMAKARNMPIPLPPLHEQEQIVVKLQELMAFCDGLEQSIKESQGYNEMLLQQVLREALQPKVETKEITLESRKIGQPLKTILAGHIINLNNTTDFGRVKFQKLLYLTEYCCKIDFDSSYVKKAAGPYDDELIKKIEVDFARLRLYNVVQDKTETKRVRYTALPGAKEIENLFLENYPDESVKINNFLMKLRPLSWGECEVVATIYAVWNNRIIKKEPVTDDLLYNDFMAWDAQKIKYKDIFYKKLFWMKEENIIADGWGKYVDRPNMKMS